MLNASHRQGKTAAARTPAARPWPALLFAALAFDVHALEQETQTWATTQLWAPLTDDSYLGVRYRARFADVFDAHRLDQYQVTASTTTGDGLVLTAGYEVFRSPDETLEHRVFPQLEFRTAWLGLDLRHRLRVEARDVRRIDERAYRVRYGVAYTRPLGDRGAYLVLSDEVFFSASEIDGVLERGFSQNRIGGGMGLRLGDWLRAEVGYQWGYIDSGFLERGDHLIQLQLVFDGRR